MSPPGEGRPEAATGQGGLSPAVLRVLTANHDRFLAFLARRVQPREVAQEILQEAFVRGMARGGALRADESAIAWFYRLLRNALVDHARGQSVEARGIAALAREADSRVEAETDQELVDTICACVTDLVGTLRPDYAAAIQRLDLDGESLQSFAATAGITRGNAAVRVFRARQALRRRVEQSCGTCATHGCYECECRREAHPPAG